MLRGGSGLLKNILVDLWGEKFATDCVEEAALRYGKNCSSQHVLAVAIGKLLKPKASQAQTAKIWEAFSAEYQARYRTEPVRNATVNGQMTNFLKRIGAAEAPSVAVFYVQHNDPAYLRNAHSVGMMTKDAEKLRTEWKTGQKVSTRRQTNVEVNADLAGDLWRRNKKGEL